ncbi:MAG TPA: NAD(P)-dependent oxidoreductase [Bryobacteraceae bacterium]|jgi:putative NADH-flavin reductase|nr:NAD(P)-dependent oxidoreductase [Bryobacteraceae bacterium]
MKVVLVGATGRAGSRILQELLARGHQVTAVVRDSAKAQLDKRAKTAVSDLSNTAQLAEITRGADAVISAYAPPPDNTDELIGVTRRLIDAVAASGAQRLMVVGGAGALEVAPGVSLIDSGKLPPEWLPIAKSHAKALDVLRSSNIDWTYLAPAAFFEPGERTGKFRLGKDNLIANDKGESRISMEDYAIALVDELENPQHSKQRFSVGY